MSRQKLFDAYWGLGYHDLKFSKLKKNTLKSYSIKYHLQRKRLRKLVRKRVLQARGAGSTIDVSLFSTGLTQAYSKKMALLEAKKKDI